MDRFVSRLVSIVLVVVSILAFSDRASAAVRKYSSRGAARFISPTEFVGEGYATHLGVYREAGSVAFSPTSDPAVLHVEGAIIYTAADGSELHAEIAGELNGATGEVSATVTYVGGTERFADASGSATLAGQGLPDGTISITVSGTIDY